MKARYFVSLCSLAVSAAIAGCIYTTGAGGSGPAGVTFQSIPQGAQVYSDGASCTTPCTLNLSASDSHAVTINSPGYKAYSVQLHPEKQSIAQMPFAPSVSVLKPNPILAVLECADESVCGARAFIKKYGGPVATPAP